MTLPRTVADVLTEHVVLEIESIDRMFLNVYQPLLQHPRALVGWVNTRDEVYFDAALIRKGVPNIGDRSNIVTGYFRD
ncbi:hypothetical protein [Acrocarpospora sp. B8E8]|uniref:hypothetical protein n=1 Tax=Acrocarpospora sp. B8E8 TaxID=3153572 RepID=UPI00325DD07F